MGDLAVKQSGILTPSNMTEALQFAETMAASALVPPQFKNKPADIVVAVQWASEVGLSPFAALQNMAVINGKPSLYADGLLALVTGHPEYYSHREWQEGDVAYCEIVRRRPTGNLVTTTNKFSIGDAKRARLWGKSGPWTNYPRRMMQMRARGFAVRDAFPDALSGVITREEAEDYPVKSDAPIDITDQVVVAPSNPFDDALGADAEENDALGSTETGETDAQIPTDPEKPDVSESALEDATDEGDERAWEMNHENGILEYPTADKWMTAMWKAWKDIEADEDMSFEDRRHEIGEHKKDHDQTIDRLKAEHPDKAEKFGSDYKKILRRLSAKAKEAAK